MLQDLMGKLQEAQKQMDETKKRLNTIYVDAEAEGGSVKVTANANKRITNITINQELVDEKDKDAIEDLVLTAINRVLEKAEQIYDNEMGNAAKNMLPNIPGLF
jgi:nucleoid-associated protein EbfC